MSQAIPIEPALWDEGCRADPVRNEFVVPTLARLIRDGSFRSVIDIGCGTGYVSRAVSSLVGDPSLSWTLLDQDASALKYAAEHGGSMTSARFVHSGLEEFALGGPETSYDLAILSYTMLEVEHLGPFADALRAVTAHGTVVMFIPDVVPDVVDHYLKLGPMESAAERSRAAHTLEKLNSFTGQRQTFIARQAIDYVAATIDRHTMLEGIESYSAPRGGRHFALTFARSGAAQ